MTNATFLDRHPASLSDADRAAMRAAAPEAFDEEASAAGADTEREEAAAGATQVGDVDAEAGDTEGAVKDGAEANGATEAKGSEEANDGAEPAAGKSPMIPKARFDEVNTELKSVKGRLEALEQQRQAVLAPVKSERDFKAERAEFKKKYDDGEIDLDEYLEKREEITVAEAKQAALEAQVESSAATAKAQAQLSWDTRIKAWEAQHAEFLKNTLRRDAVADLFVKIGKANPELSDEELIARVEQEAFEAFNYTPGASGKKQDALPTNPHAARDAKDAAATARAGATPPPLSGGLGDRGRDAGVDITRMKPGQFSKLPRDEQARLLGGEDAL